MLNMTFHESSSFGKQLSVHFDSTVSQNDCQTQHDIDHLCAVVFSGLDLTHLKARQWPLLALWRAFLYFCRKNSLDLPNDVTANSSPPVAKLWPSSEVVHNHTPFSKKDSTLSRLPSCGICIFGACTFAHIYCACVSLSVMSYAHRQLIVVSDMRCKSSFGSLSIRPAPPH